MKRKRKNPDEESRLSVCVGEQLEKSNHLLIDLITLEEYLNKLSDIDIADVVPPSLDATLK